ncbi:MAG: hypothetical protein HQK62_13605, partial [Desulfamplus sp.]|nr:hypothetical protein [Desulfamplus sp.]
DDDLELSPPPMPSGQKPSSSPSLQKESTLEIDNGLELDLDFSLEDDMAFSAPSKSATKLVDTESGLELDMDFSKDSDQGLELEVEDESEFDFDFSSENDQVPTDTNNKTETMRNTESISPMDFDFDTDEELEKDENLFGVDISDQVTGKKAEENSKQTSEQKISLNKSAASQTSLGGHPIKSIGQGSTLLGDRPSIFEDSSLFEEK